MHKAKHSHDDDFEDTLFRRDRKQLKMDSEEQIADPLKFAYK
jgi:hypothetical protein